MPNKKERISVGRGQKYRKKYYKMTEKSADRCYNTNNVVISAEKNSSYLKREFEEDGEDHEKIYRDTKTDGESLFEFI